MIHDNTCIDIDVANTVLTNIANEGSIRAIELYGGELSLLPENVLLSIISSCQLYTNKISITTNLSKLNIVDISLGNGLELFTSINKSRPINNKTIRQLFSLGKETRKNIGVLTVVDRTLMAENNTTLINFYNDLGIKSVNFIQLYPSEHSKTTSIISNREYCNWVLDFINDSENKINFKLINKSPEFGTPNSNNHIFVNPSGQYGATTMENGIERFVWFDEFDQWQEYTNSEYARIPECLTCKYFMKCAAEHRYPHDKNDICSGRIPLIRYYESIKCFGYNNG
jgi:hypothetical protein